ncbi:MAG: hypothetical protein AAB448_01470 [Patescibacteria group bacterium]
MDFTADRELIFLRAYENALSSAFAHGSMLTDFSFALPRADDVLVFANGNKAYRKDTSESGYTADELALHTTLIQPTSLSVPLSFLDDEETIREAHANDLSEIARGLVRDIMQGDAMNGVSTITDVFLTFARASFSFHEALLHATDALLHIDHAPTAAHLMHMLFPALLQKSKDFSLAVRRFKHPDFASTIEQGADNQLRIFLTCGQALDVERDFFDHQLQLPPFYLTRIGENAIILA